MNLHKTFAIGLALVGVLGVAGAQADTITKGTFTLPAQAYWNNTLLQPGDYTLALDRSLAGIDIVTLHGEGISAEFLTPAGAMDHSVRSCLRFDNINGTYVVREFEAGPIGKSYRFPVSKVVKKLTLSGAVAQPVTISVASGM